MAGKRFSPTNQQQNHIFCHVINDNLSSISILFGSIDSYILLDPLCTFARLHTNRLTKTSQSQARIQKRAAANTFRHRYSFMVLVVSRQICVPSGFKSVKLIFLPLDVFWRYIFFF